MTRDHTFLLSYLLEAGRNNPGHYPLPTHFSDGETEAPQGTEVTWAELGLTLACLPLLSEILFLPVPVPRAKSGAGTAIPQTGRPRPCRQAGWPSHLGQPRAGGGPGGAASTWGALRPASGQHRLQSLRGSRSSFAAAESRPCCTTTAPLFVLIVAKDTSGEFTLRPIRARPAASGALTWLRSHHHAHLQASSHLPN